MDGRLRAELEELPFVDEHRQLVDAPAADAWSALLRVVGRRSRGTALFARILGCEPAGSTPVFEGRVGDTVPGFRVAAAEPGRRLELRGRHRFARYALTFGLDEDGLRARTNAEFPGLRGRLYRAAVLGSGGHRVLTKAILRRIARTARRGAGAGERRAGGVANLLLALATGFLGLTASVGGAMLLLGVYAPPVEMLRGSWFGGYVMPGLALGLGVGGSALLATWLLARRDPRGPVAAAAAGLILLTFEFVQVVSIGSPPGASRNLQVGYFGLGLGIVGAALALLSAADERSAR